MADGQLDIEKVSWHEAQMMLKLTRLVTMQERTHEMNTATVVALSNVMIMMVSSMVGIDEAEKTAMVAIKRSIRVLREMKTEMKNEADTNPSQAGG